MARNDTYIQLKETLPELSIISTCFRIFIEYARTWPPIISYALPDSDQYGPDDNNFLVGKFLLLFDCLKLNNISFNIFNLPKLLNL